MGTVPLCNLFVGYYWVVVRPTSKNGISLIWSRWVSTRNNVTNDGACPDNDVDLDTGASACIELTSDEIGIS
jgi:hypothetical protein